jgi:soluble lytic murein transglycosylase-like protein
LQLGFLMTAATLFLSLSLFSVAPIGQGQSGAMALKQAISLFASRTSNGLAAINMQQALDVPTAAPTQETQTETSGVVASGDYHAIARQAAVDHGISPDYFERQIQQESGFNPYAVSPAGALGIAQFIPSTAAGLGIDPLDPVQALNGAATLMADLASQFGGNYAMALAGYNAGPVATQNAINSCGDAWLSCLSAETQNYIAIIMG